METERNLERARLPVLGEKDAVFPVMSRESMDSFLSYLESQGKTKATVETYRRCLERFFAFLPDDKGIGADTLRQWRDSILAEGAAVGTANPHIAAANPYLEFVWRKELHLKAMPHEKPLETPTLTWTEYLRLLETARTLEDRPYWRNDDRVSEKSDTSAVSLRFANGTAGLCVRRQASERFTVRQVERKPACHSEVLPMIVKLFKKAGVPRNKVRTYSVFRCYPNVPFKLIR